MDIVLGNYKGLRANIPYIAYTEEDVNSQIATTRVLRTELRLRAERLRNILWESVQALLFRALRSSL